MATSGSTAITSTRNSIIRGAFRLLGLKKNKGSMLSEDIDNAAETLNLMISSWQADDFGMWLNKNVTLFLGKGTASYTLGSTGNHATLTPRNTQISTAGSSGDSTITVDSITNITNGDYIGIELDDGELQWTTVNGVPSGSTVTLTAALTDDVAADNYVYNYTTKILRPLEIFDARRIDSNDNEIELDIYSRNEYMTINDKTLESTPSGVYYDPQLTNGVLYVWPTASDVTTQILFSAKYPIEIFDDYFDDPAFPQQWLEAIKYNLAVRISTEYINDINPNVLKVIIPIAEKLYEEITTFDSCGTSVFFKPNLGE